ncbi:type II toxin-antitoxin system VapC family toxin [Candidatus Pacearchaeota archaeon]|nr:type II toxin-antitoxin system VapC family toxin [Candidatus Pacearchaeota archaeon]
MERQKKVLDASIIVKWFSKEENTEKALLLRDQHINQEIEIVIPEMAFLEVINSLRYKKKSEEELKKAIKDLWDVQLKIVALTADLLNKTVKIALNYNLTIYDSLYVSIAKLYGASLITADTDIVKLPEAISIEKMKID